jgi:hypothetical protein
MIVALLCNIIEVEVGKNKAHLEFQINVVNYINQLISPADLKTDNPVEVCEKFLLERVLIELLDRKSW